MVFLFKVRMTTIGAYKQGQDIVISIATFEQTHKGEDKGVGAEPEQLVFVPASSWAAVEPQRIGMRHHHSPHGPGARLGLWCADVEVRLCWLLNDVLSNLTFLLLGNSHENSALSTSVLLPLMLLLFIYLLYTFLDGWCQIWQFPSWRLALSSAERHLPSIQSGARRCVSGMADVLWARLA